MRTMLFILIFVAFAAAAPAVELLDARVTAGAVPVLQNAGGTVRLEHAQVNATAHPTFTVPEPGIIGLLGAGIGGLVLLHTRRRRATPRTPSIIYSPFTQSSTDGWGLRAAAFVLAMLTCLTLVAGPASAQVPQDMTFSGRLVDGAGIPLVGPLDFALSIYDALTGGTLLYVETHSSVTLDAQGNFSVLVGTGATPPFAPSFDSALFSDVERYVEVEMLSPTFEVLNPRVPLASVPWALVAQQANEIVPDPSAPRFEDCGDGTVADHQTGLQWEKKTGTVGSSVFCDTVACPDPHDVNNRYPWSLASPFEDPDGAAFTDFLAKLNDPVFGTAATPSDVTGCFAGHCDWRLPNIVELQTILDCGLGNPCIDPIFGPTRGFDYWSASTHATAPSLAWKELFSVGGLTPQSKIFPLDVRAVRTGSCN